MNQINVEEALGCGSLSVQPTDSAGRGEGNKQGAAASAIYLAVIDD